MDELKPFYQKPTMSLSDYLQAGTIRSENPERFASVTGDPSLPATTAPSGGLSMSESCARVGRQLSARATDSGT